MRNICKCIITGCTISVILLVLAMDMLAKSAEVESVEAHLTTWVRGSPLREHLWMIRQ